MEFSVKSGTGQHPQNLTDMERRVFDLIARRSLY